MIVRPYKSWRVSRSDREPLLRFLHQGLQESGCQILHSTGADSEPFLITFETPAGERMGILCYAFLANSKLTRNRPADEHRFQIKLGSDAKAILEMHEDPLGLVTTLLIGIDTDRQFLVGADPALHNPTPMFISIEFKRHHADAIVARGWHAWERVRRNRPYEPAEVLIGATRAHLLDYIRFERAAKGLDQGHRQLLAEKVVASLAVAHAKPFEHHRLIGELGLNETALLDLINETARLKMAVRGWVAEVHLEETLRAVPGVTDCARLNAEGRPDISLRYLGRGPFLIECKNVLRDAARDGIPRLDFQKTRASKSDPCSRYYRPADFAIVAACLHAITERWEFRYATTASLPPHRKCRGRIQNALRVDDGWTTDAEAVLGIVSGRAA